MGPLRFSKCDLSKTFPAEKVTFHNGDFFNSKGLVKVTFNSPFPNLVGPIPKTFPAEKVTFHNGDFFGCKGLVKVTFNSPFPKLVGPIPKTFKLLKV